MKKKLYIILLGILLILLVVAGYVYFNQATKSIMYEDFRIEGSTATYNYNTRTGMVDLKIVYKGGGLKKLFLTSDDVIGNGFDFIVDVGNSIAIYDGKRNLKCRGYEIDYGGSTQKVRISYTDRYARIKEGKLTVKVIDSNSKKVKAEVPVKLKFDKEYKKFDRVTGPEGERTGAVYISKSGIRVLTDQSVAMEPEHNKTSTIYLKKSKPSIVVITDPSESMKNTKNERITKARVFDVNSNAGEYVYALELEEWNQVVQAGIGRYIFKK
nr:hypothetical protein [uncultured Dorea sp.]